MVVSSTLTDCSKCIAGFMLLAPCGADWCC